MTIGAALFTLVLSLGASGTLLPETPSGRDSTDAVTWESRTACPYSCRRCGGASDGTYFYVLGGWDGVNTRAYNYRYDPGSNSWLQRQNMPTAVSNAGVCYSPQYNAIFVLGGLVQSGDSVTLVQRYDVTSNSWTSNATLPYQDYGIAAVALGDYLYVLFGSGHPGRFWRYHPQTGAWVELAQCTGASSHAALCVRGGLVYASGGWTQNSMFKCYNPGTNAWQTLPALPQARHGHGMDTVGTRVYVYGGGQTWGATQNCWSYNPVDSTWANEGPMLQPHIGGAFAAVVTDGITRLHAACGHYATDRHERGNPASPDVGVVAIVAPTGTIDTLQPVTPTCSVANFGLASVSFRVRCRVGAFYNDTTIVSALAPGAKAYAAFPARANWPRGRYAVTCSTELAGDANPGNDRMTDSVTVSVRDVGTRVIVAPSGSIDSGVAVTPACSLYNHGTTTEVYRVRFRIGTSYVDTTEVVNHAPGVVRYVTLPPWSSSPRGSLAISCSTELAGDANRSNDRRTSVVEVGVHDVGCVCVTSPASTLDSGVSVVPICTVANQGMAAESYFVRLRIGTTYNNFGAVVGHAPGSRLAVTFPVWQVSGRGRVTVSCSTELSGDVRPANNRVTSSVEVRITDVAMQSVSRPLAWERPGDIPVTVRVVNLGTAEAVQIRVTATIRDSLGSEVYRDSASVASLAAGDRAEVGMGNWSASAGRFRLHAAALLAGDMNPENDTAGRTVLVAATGGGFWTERHPMPGLPSSKQVKHGAWLTSAGELVYAAKGNKTPDFYCYGPVADSWTRLAPIPPGREGRPPSKGAAGCASGAGRIFALKGNNTLGFWSYNTTTDSWTQLADVPSGATNRKVKGGSDLVCQNDKVYVLKGITRDFLVYDPGADTWGTLAEAPATKYDRGSWLCLDAAGSRIYCHQAKYHAFHAYDLASNSWGPVLRPMPLVNQSGRVKKSKDGGCGAWLDQQVFCLKGGNTQEFWAYYPAGDSWAELETLPMLGSSGKKRKVKAGADITAWSGALFALKGNSTLELWQYLPALDAPRRSPLCSPISGFQLLPAAAPQSSILRLPEHPTTAPPEKYSVYDPTGRRVSLPAAWPSPVGPGRLRPGVYFVVRASGATKVVVLR